MLYKARGHSLDRIDSACIWSAWIWQAERPGGFFIMEGSVKAQHPGFRNRYVSITMGTALAVVLVFAVVSACTNVTQAKGKTNIVVKDNPPKPGVVARIGGEDITEEQLIGDDKMEFFELEKRRYELKMERIQQIAQDRLVAKEAQKAGMSPNDFIEKKVVKGDENVSDKEVKKFIEERHIPESQAAQYKDRIIGFLKGQKRQEAIQAYLGKLTKDSPVEVYFKRPKIEVQVDPGNGPSFGGKDAKVQVVEFSDFQCPYCSRAAETVSQIKKKYGNKIRLTFRHFPLQMHPNARPASEASMCVNEQGADKFWKFHDLAFKSQDKLDAAGLEGFAKQAGADVAKFNDCVKAKKYADFVQKDFEYGDKVGVRSTPTFFINGQLVAGALPIESFSEIIDEELEAKK